MKIIHLRWSGATGSCNSYLILGDWNRTGDVNTIIDPGSSNSILEEMDHLPTGLGKIPVAQVILTHNHFNHAGAAEAIKARYNARVLAFSQGAGVSELLSDGQFVKAGDGILEVLHTPGHTSDSICLYAPAEKALFSGDTQLRITTPDGRYAWEYTEALIKIACRDIQKIYSGHDEPMTSGCQEMIFKTLDNVRNGNESFP